MNIILWILFGALVGWIASIIMGTNRQQGALANIIIGVIGAVIGGWLMKALTGSSANSWFSQLIVAIIGAIIVISAWQMFSSAGDHSHH